VSLFRSSTVCALVLAMSLMACTEDKNSVGPRTHDPSANAPSFTMGTGSSSTPLGRATFSDPDDENINVKRKTGDWQVDIKAKPAFDIAVQTIVFQPGGQSGWHSHPGPVFIQVVSGTMTFYESDDPTCTPIVRTAGQGYLDKGEHAHIARNETSLPAKNLVTYFAPPGAALKIDEPNPGNCPF
jgi:hypothetical protein